MRVSESLMFQRMARSASNSSSLLDEVSEPLFAGKNLVRPSDNPLEAQRLLRTQRAMRRADQHNSSVSRVRVYHQLVETTVSNVTDVLQDLQQLAVQFANDSYDIDERQVGAPHAIQLMDNLQSLANSQFGGRFIFAGRLQDQPAYDAANNFQGDPTVRKVRIADQETIDADVTGPTVFGPAGATAFDAVQSLVTALNANDTAGIQAAIDLLNTAHQRAVTARSGVGYHLVELQRTENANEDEIMTHKIAEGAINDVDIGKAASEMTFAEHVYQASIQTSKRLAQVLESQNQL